MELMRGSRNSRLSEEMSVFLAELDAFIAGYFPEMNENVILVAQERSGVGASCER